MKIIVNLGPIASEATVLLTGDEISSTKPRQVRGSEWLTECYRSYPGSHILNPRFLKLKNASCLVSVKLLSTTTVLLDVYPKYSWKTINPVSTEVGHTKFVLGRTQGRALRRLPEAPWSLLPDLIRYTVITVPLSNKNRCLTVTPEKKVLPNLLTSRSGVVNRSQINTPQTHD